MAETTIHRGSFADIPATATPGLAWLKKYMDIIDSLEGDAGRISALVKPEAQFIFNGKAVGATAQVVAALNGRRDKLSVFRHDGAAAWDIVSGGRTRTVMFESTSFSEFKGDAEGTEARVAEFSVVELAKDGAGDGSWKAVELKTFMDPSPVSPGNRGKQS